MLGYICKYTPVEVLNGFGETVIKIEPTAFGSAKVDALLHPNLCAYAKAVLEEIMTENTLEGIILVNCCDSIRRLYDVVKFHWSDKFVYMIDVPRKNDSSAVRLFVNEIKKLIRSYGEFSGKSFDSKCFRVPKPYCVISDEVKNSKVNIIFMGARCKQSIIDIIQNAGAVVAYNFTCSSQPHDKVDFVATGNEDIDYFTYAHSLLQSYPCFRMADIDNRLLLLEKNIKKIDGIIYHTIKFCDFYSYEYTQLQDRLNVPILKIESDYTEQCESQMRTRIEAFTELLTLQRQATNFSHLEKNKNANLVKKNKEQAFFAAGIDSGSTSTNVAIIDDSKKIISFAVIRTGAKTIDSANKALNEALVKANLTREQIFSIVATGYGRSSIPFADKSITEITCHGKGAHYLNAHVRTVIDIGGQDSKIIRLNNKGEVIDFIMNNKCSAGTGRFFEAMARTLEISIEEMGPASQKWKKEINITNMCTVFAESEVISLIAQNNEKEDIIYGLCNAVARKTISLMGKLGNEGGYMMTGGVARNFGVVRTIENMLGERIIVYDRPEIVGAIGAALLGLE